MDSAANARKGVLLLAALVLSATGCVTTESKSSSLPGGSADGGGSSRGSTESARSDPAPAPEPYRFRTQNELFVRLDGALKASRELIDDPLKTGKLEDFIRGAADANLSVLLSELSIGSERNRIIAAGALGYSTNPVVRGPLAKALEDESSSVVSNALHSLAIVGRPGDGLDAAIARLRDPDPAVRSNAALALATVTPRGGASLATEPLVIALLDEDPVTRANAALALGAIGDGDAVGHLAQALSDDMPRVRALAAQSLGQLKARGAIRALVGRLEDQNSLVRDRVRQALIAITGHDRGPDPKAWEADLRS